ncbi:outer membrane protein assembly factor BamB [Acrasis kona]|uniref:Outer membrane protein assembly factor BamB n=1 Tax=Acrasis kona TaxID=1008807 RepID=A0AAW2ZQ31_9EUKA
MWRTGTIILLLIVNYAISQANKISSNEQLQKNKFSERRIISVEDVIFSQDASKFHPQSKCKKNVDLAWTTTLGSSIYQTPIVEDLRNDDHKQIIVPTFVRYLEVLRGDNGVQHSDQSSFPFIHPNLVSHSSATTFDIDSNGVDEIVMYTADAEVLFFSTSGSLLSDYTIKIPPLKVDKHWHRGLEDRDDVDLQYNLHQNTPNKGSNRKILQVDEKKKSRQEVAAGTEGSLSKEARDSLKLIFGNAHQEFIDEAIFKPKNYDAEQKKRVEQEAKPGTEWVYVDAHLLATPLIIDIDGDGVDEMILPVSYFFDREKYMNNAGSIPIDVNIADYIAGGIVCVELKTGTVKWQIHLDMTTERVMRRAYIYSSPTVIDLDLDGHLEIIIGTSLGWIYVITDKGEMYQHNFPVMMGEIQAQVIAEDINNDGNVEICAVDYNSNLACFDEKGNAIWERRLSGSTSTAPTVGDVNNDGILDLIIGTNSGAIFAVSGSDGKDIEHFPIKTGHSIHSQATLLKMDQGMMTIIVPSFDGFVYMIDGPTGCIDKIDIGENSYSQVLVSDLNHDGKLELLVTTMNGNVYNLGTQVPYHPMKVREHHGYLTRDEYHGIHATLGSRGFRDVIGSKMSVEFEIVDNRKMPSHVPRSYQVDIKVRSKGQTADAFTKRYEKPGTYVAIVDVPSKPFSSASVSIVMKNDRGQLFKDSFSVTLNSGFLNLFKWIIVIPFTACATIVLFGWVGSRNQLPT